MSKKRPLAVILTALPVEAKAVCSMINVQGVQPLDSGACCEHGEFVVDDTVICRVAVAEIGMGSDEALLETHNVVRELKPDCLFFVGVAGGVKDMQVGDVVIGDKVYGYEQVKIEERPKSSTEKRSDGIWAKIIRTFSRPGESSSQEQVQLNARPQLEHSSKELISLSRIIARKTDWLQRVSADEKQKSIQAKVAPIATGGKLHATTKSQYYLLIKRSYNDTAAVEMEGIGFLRAIREHQGKPAIVIRGISDLLDKKGASDAGGSQEIASAHAAAFAFELLAQYLDTKTPGRKLSALDDSPPTEQESGDADNVVQSNSSIIAPSTSDRIMADEDLTPVQQMIEDHVCKELEFLPELFQLMWEKLHDQVKGETALEATKILCRHPIPRWPLDKLKDPVFSFLDKLQLHEPAKLPNAVERVKMIIGWLLLRAVDERFLIDQIGQPAPDQGFRLEIGLHEYAPVEVVIAFTGKRSAGYQTEIQSDQVYGLGAIDLNRLAEFGYRKEDQVEGMIRAVWKIIYGSDRPEVKGDNPEEQRKDRLRLDQRLNTALRESSLWEKDFYCMSSGNEQHNPLNDPDVIELLRYRVPCLKMIAFGVKGRGTGVTWAGEELSEYIRNFLIRLRQYT
ncbi:MAG: hypothetical protein Q3M30_07810 [Candidatus Electrothrix sp. Rat3]|nr:hypothetical protein [Candidatus Electrothrix rattekaaiensis]